jgi:DNA-binding transcriptional ArsR family regulator
MSVPFPGRGHRCVCREIGRMARVFLSSENTHFRRRDVSSTDETYPPVRRYTPNMNVFPIAVVAELIGEPARAAILVALLDGRALPAGELAFISRVSAQSASGHLSKLVDGGLLSVQSEGRHRYYKIASAEVGHALEALGAISTAPQRATALDRLQTNDLRIARTCYDHLAGVIAVEITKALEASEILEPFGERDYELGAGGEAWFAEIGVKVSQFRSSRRSFARRCLDWTERKPHLAGALGAALCSRVIALNWVVRRPKTRALRLTLQGQRGLHKLLGITM